jgi:hypothetical protein
MDASTSPPAKATPAHEPEPAVTQAASAATSVECCEIALDEYIVSAAPLAKQLNCDVGGGVVGGVGGDGGGAT